MVFIVGALVSAGCFRYIISMVSLRRALFTLLSTFALLFAFGTATAALACPFAQHAKVNDEKSNDCCGGPQAPDCVLVNCTLICQALPPTNAGIDGKPSLSMTSYASLRPMLHSDVSGPEPPPPRLV